MPVQDVSWIYIQIYAYPNTYLQDVHGFCQCPKTPKSLMKLCACKQEEFGVQSLHPGVWVDTTELQLWKESKQYQRFKNCDEWNILTGCLFLSWLSICAAEASTLSWLRKENRAEALKSQAENIIMAHEGRSQTWGTETEATAKGEWILLKN